MSLDLNIVKIAGAGRPSKPIDYEIGRELTPADMVILETKPLNQEVPAIQKITDRHHALARLLAAGTSEGEIALITGYSLARISTLKHSPALIDLIALYAEKKDQEFIDVYEHLAGLSRDALVTLRDRLDDTPDRFSNKDLMAVVTDSIDRAPPVNPNDAVLPDLIELVAGDDGKSTG